MPLGLHEQCEARLIGVLSKVLPMLSINHGMFVERSSTIGLLLAEQVLPTTGKIHENLAQYAGDYPLVDFVVETISTELADLDRYLPDTPSLKLNEIPEYADCSAIATSLVERFESLPWSYALTIELPRHWAPVLNVLPVEYPLSATVRIIRGNAARLKSFPLAAATKAKSERLYRRTLLGGFDIDTETPKWEPGASYLQIEFEGFVGRYGGQVAESEARRRLRIFAGLGIGLSLFQFKYAYQPFPLKKDCYVHRQFGNDWVIDNVLTLDEDQASVLVSLEPNLHDGADADANNKTWIGHCLKSIAKAFSVGKPAESILLAAQWLFDSYAGRDELLNYVQAMVVLEILLGDKAVSDEVGLGQLLRNRCAYLIGTNHEERAQLLTEFGDIYQVRSQILHRGKHRLGAQERTLFNRLRLIGRRVIQQEVKLVAGAN